MWLKKQREKRNYISQEKKTHKSIWFINTFENLFFEFKWNWNTLTGLAELNLVGAEFGVKYWCVCLRNTAVSVWEILACPHSNEIPTLHLELCPKARAGWPSLNWRNQLTGNKSINSLSACQASLVPVTQEFYHLVGNQRRDHQRRICLLLIRILEYFEKQFTSAWA